MKLPLIGFAASSIVALVAAAACGSLTPANSAACAGDACGCLPVECGAGACCPNGYECMLDGTCLVAVQGPPEALRPQIKRGGAR